MLLSGNGHPWEAWERPEEGRSGGLYALSLRGFSGSSSLPPPDGASSSVGFHRSSCGFPSFSHPLKDLSLVSACVSSGHLPLLPPPCLPSRQGTGGRVSWERLDRGSSCPSGGVGRRKGASFLTVSPAPEATGRQAGRFLTTPAGSFPRVAPAGAPHPGQLSHKWGGLEAWPSRGLPPLPPSTQGLFLLPRRLQGPGRFLIPTAASSAARPRGAWRWPDGPGLTALLQSSLS